MSGYLIYISFLVFLIPRLVEPLGLEQAEVRALEEERQECVKPEEGKESIIHSTIGRRPQA